MKKWNIVFGSALILNFIWENLHSALYLHYKQGAITEFILLRASLVDAIIIILLVGIFLFLGLLPKYDWLIIITGILVSVNIELWALATERWAYSPAMPILPILDIGLTPAVQLGLTGYLAYHLGFRIDLK
ncbi:MAG: Membrane protein [Parcubacteria group bacterium GW2011_GWE2_39_37]|uniref:Membrane protein n=1 Tax=Candidatus Falkowbacteria bacterium GW2011_GWF2_39_8 TaxID=1618642 RepID=A0A0G0Q1E7_9BACT|nr:MAG: Membrane protein [Parcubacteria group bacterium GW2011_GWE2_39_37]KKR31151.1 MAG: Membrane protein [Candidatus Falkowbacteria bacterium GW2011_GWF2_39_8]